VLLVVGAWSDYTQVSADLQPVRYSHLSRFTTYEWAAFVLGIAGNTCHSRPNSEENTNDHLKPVKGPAGFQRQILSVKQKQICTQLSKQNVHIKK
jgi:hypothetical protein